MEDCFECTFDDIEAFKAKFNKFMDLRQTKAAQGAVYQAVLDMNWEMEFWEKACKEICCKDWNRHLTDVSSIQCSEEFAFVVRAVEPNCYKNELRYPIVSASLFTLEHDKLYLDRKVVLILDMDPHYLIGMSLWDSTTAEGSEGSIFDFPLYVRDTPVTSTFGSEDKYDDFETYSSRLALKNTGELTFGSEVGVQAVLYFDGASYEDVKFAESYSCVYGLPVFRYKPGLRIERMKPI